MVKSLELQERSSPALRSPMMGVKVYDSDTLVNTGGGIGKVSQVAVSFGIRSSQIFMDLQDPVVTLVRPVAVVWTGITTQNYLPSPTSSLRG